MSTSIVPVKKGRLVKYEEPPIIGEIRSFTTREEVRQNLPDICGKVLARAWHDKDYYNRLTDDVHQVFYDGGVILPDEFKLVFEHTSNNRASITIYEQQNGSKFKFRVCSLCLTMIARR